jgi:hypothetical protein
VINFDNYYTEVNESCQTSARVIQRERHGCDMAINLPYLVKFGKRLKIVHISNLWMACRVGGCCRPV